MTGVLYPIAANPEAALSAPLGRASLLTDARNVAGAEVAFARELAGPAFETREGALAAYRGRIDDAGVMVEPADRFCDLQAVLAPGVTPRRIVWRLSLGYWKIETAAPAPAVRQAREARRRKDSRALAAAELGAMAGQPLRPINPQKALDIGLFEVRLPEDPAALIPDE